MTTWAVPAAAPGKSEQRGQPASSTCQQEGTSPRNAEEGLTVFLGEKMPFSSGLEALKRADI